MKEKRNERERIFFYSTGHYFKGEYCLEVLQYSLHVEKHCSNSNLKNRDGKAIGVGF